MDKLKLNIDYGDVNESLSKSGEEKYLSSNEFDMFLNFETPHYEYTTEKYSLLIEEFDKRLEQYKINVNTKYNKKVSELLNKLLDVNEDIYVEETKNLREELIAELKK